MDQITVEGSICFSEDSCFREGEAEESIWILTRFHAARFGLS
jgi:hypothetical protein